MFKKFKNWFRTKGDVLEYVGDLERRITELNQVIVRKAWEYLPKIEALDQQKVYYVVAEDERDCEDLKMLFANLRAKVKWTLPPIFITTRPFKELTKEEIQTLKDQWRKK